RPVFRRSVNCCACMCTSPYLLGTLERFLPWGAAGADGRPKRTFSIFHCSFLIFHWAGARLPSIHKLRPQRSLTRDSHPATGILRSETAFFVHAVSVAGEERPLVHVAHGILLQHGVDHPLTNAPSPVLRTD